MKKKITSVLLTEDEKIDNQSKKDTIEIDVKQFMKEIHYAQIANMFIMMGAVVLVIYLMVKLPSGEEFSFESDYVYIISTIVLFLIGTLLKKIKWVPKTKSEPKVIINLSKSEIENLENSETVAGIIANKEYEKLDSDGDGRILISEYYTMSEAEVENEIKSLDGNFSVEGFKNYAKSVFVLVQNSWSNNDFRMLRPFQTDSLYYRQKLRIEDMIEDNFINKRTNIRVKGMLLKDFRVDGDYEILVVALTANMKITHPEVVYSTASGDVPYILKFVRKHGVKTKTITNLSTSNCCNCGASIDVDDRGVCKYCGTSLVSGDTDWVLSDIRNIKISGM